MSNVSITTQHVLPSLTKQQTISPFICRKQTSPRVVVFLAGRVNRPRAPLLVPCGLLLLSVVLASISAALTGNSRSVQAARIALIYTAIVVEFWGEVATFLWLHSNIRYPPGRISERLACLTLIILGEGIIGLLRSFGVSLAVFSDQDGALYAQIIGCLAIIWIVFLLSFEGFNK